MCTREKTCTISGTSATVVMGAPYTAASLNVVGRGNPPSIRLLLWATVSSSFTKITAEAFIDATKGKDPTDYLLAKVTAATPDKMPFTGPITANPRNLIRATAADSDFLFSVQIPVLLRSKSLLARLW